MIESVIVVTPRIEKTARKKKCEMGKDCPFIKPQKKKRSTSLPRKVGGKGKKVRQRKSNGCNCEYCKSTSKDCFKKALAAWNYQELSLESSGKPWANGKFTMPMKCILAFRRTSVGLSRQSLEGAENSKTNFHLWTWSTRLGKKKTRDLPNAALNDQKSTEGNEKQEEFARRGRFQLHKELFQEKKTLLWCPKQTSEEVTSLQMRRIPRPAWRYIPKKRCCIWWDCLLWAMKRRRLSTVKLNSECSDIEVEDTMLNLCTEGLEEFQKLGVTLSMLTKKNLSMINFPWLSPMRREILWQKKTRVRKESSVPNQEETTMCSHIFRKIPMCEVWKNNNNTSHMQDRTQDARGRDCSFHKIRRLHHGRSEKHLNVENESRYTKTLWSSNMSSRIGFRVIRCKMKEKSETM